jgi:putative hemolysin
VDILLILFLILMNGVFAMSEIAVVSARRARLQGRADDGSSGARVAIALQERPGGFLSTIQVGITSVGILSGAIGEAALAGPVADRLAGLPLPAGWADALALGLVVAVIAYLFVVIGELVPKQLALLAPEAIAARVARPLAWLARAALPLVWLLSTSSALVLRLLGARRNGEPPVTDEEIRMLMVQGAEAGVFHASEGAIVANVLRLDEQPIGAIMTPRNEIDYLDLDLPGEVLREVLTSTLHAELPICRGGLDGSLLGVLRIGALLPRCLAGQTVGAAELEAALHPPLVVPASLTTTQLIESFSSSRLNLALIVDEYGSVQGLVTLSDVLASIVGEPVFAEVQYGDEIVARAPGSWLVDGGLSLERLRAELGLSQPLPDEETKAFHTVGGFVMHALGRIPRVGDAVEAAGLRIEVMDMDRQRVDKVLVECLPGAPNPEPSQEPSEASEA